jgi:hypothetical protein
MSDGSSFVSVKLPAALVNHAKEAAQTMRRSVASQVEYWATLGRALEQAGLTANDSHALIARQERATYGRPPSAPSPTQPDELDDHVLALAKSGASAERTQAARGKARK